MNAGDLVDDLKKQGAKKSWRVLGLLPDGSTADIMMVEAEDNIIYLKLEVR
jgi:hypothetical protein